MEKIVDYRIHVRWVGCTSPSRSYDFPPSVISFVNSNEISGGSINSPASPFSHSPVYTVVVGKGGHICGRSKPVPGCTENQSGSLGIDFSILKQSIDQQRQRENAKAKKRYVPSIPQRLRAILLRQSEELRGLELLKCQYQYADWPS